MPGGGRWKGPWGTKCKHHAEIPNGSSSAKKCCRNCRQSKEKKDSCLLSWNLEHSGERPTAQKWGKGNSLAVFVGLCKDPTCCVAKEKEKGNGVRSFKWMGVPSWMRKSSLRRYWSNELKELSHAEISQTVIQAGETALAKGLKQQCACWDQEKPRRPADLVPCECRAHRPWPEFWGWLCRPLGAFTAE